MKVTRRHLAGIQYRRCKMTYFLEYCEPHVVMFPERVLFLHFAWWHAPAEIRRCTMLEF